MFRLTLPLIAIVLATIVLVTMHLRFLLAISAFGAVVAATPVSDVAPTEPVITAAPDPAEIFERSPRCIRGPKRVHSYCTPPNLQASVCGPGQDGNIVSSQTLCSKSLLYLTYHLGIAGMCTRSRCRTGRLHLEDQAFLQAWWMHEMPLSQWHSGQA